MSIDEFYDVKKDHVVSFIINCADAHLENIKQAICMFEGVKEHEGGYLLERMKTTLRANAKRFTEAADALEAEETKSDTRS